LLEVQERESVFNAPIAFLHAFFDPLWSRLQKRKGDINQTAGSILITEFFLRNSEIVDKSKIDSRGFYIVVDAAQAGLENDMLMYKYVYTHGRHHGVI